LPDEDCLSLVLMSVLELLLVCFDPFEPIFIFFGDKPG
jgi:hypothetical protein